MSKAKIGVLALAIIAQKGMSKEDKFKESTIETIEDYIIETESAISDIKVAVIPKLESSLKRATRSQVVAKKGIEDAYMDLGSSYSSYIKGINRAKSEYDSKSDDCASLRADIKRQKEICAATEDLLSRLKA